MIQEVIINKILRDLKQFELIPKDITGEFLSNELYRPFLNAIYAAGWEQGKLEINQHTNKLIGNYDSKGELIQEYKSLKEAAQLSGYSVKGIYKSMHRNTPMKDKTTWKYKDEISKAIPDDVRDSNF